MVFATLRVIDVIVSKYGKELRAFSVTRLLSDLLLFPERDKELYVMAKNLFSKTVEVNHSYTFYSLGRLMTVGDEELQLEIIVLLFEHVMNARKLDHVVVIEYCRMAMEDALYPSAALRLAAFDLVYGLCYRDSCGEVF